MTHCFLGVLSLNAGHFDIAQLAADLQQVVLSRAWYAAGYPVTLSLISVKRRETTGRSARGGMQAYQSAEEAVVEASVPVRLDHVGQALPVALPAHRHVRAQRLQRIRHHRRSSASRATCAVHPRPQKCIASHRRQDILDLQDQAPAVISCFSGVRDGIMGESHVTLQGGTSEACGLAHESRPPPTC